MRLCAYANTSTDRRLRRTPICLIQYFMKVKSHYYVKQYCRLTFPLLLHEYYLHASLSYYLSILLSWHPVQAAKNFYVQGNVLFYCA